MCINMYDTSVYNVVTANQVSSWTHPVRTGISLIGFFLGDNIMKKIPLTQGQFALVDDEDYMWLSQWKWFAHRKGVAFTFYAMRMVQEKGRQILCRMHREILGLKFGDKRQSDHENLHGLDNQRRNLRICTQAQNQQNQSLSKNNTSGYKGVSWHKTKKKWQSRIGSKSGRICLGHFDDKVKAAKAYDKTAKKLFGKFARLNFPDPNWRNKK